jgi:long-chain acyl-CoA synthetase
MAMSSSVAEEWLERTGCEIMEGYGLTECSPAVTVNVPGKVVAGTVGFAVPDTELCTANEAGEILSAGERGELWIKGPQVMKGYWGQEQATKDAITPEGWFKSGDYAEIDSDGYVRIVDRKKDMILVSGFNVFPNEIEDWVDRHPRVLESAAIGIPNERTGEVVKLFVIAHGEQPSVDDIIAHCREGLTTYKVPKEVVFVNDLPKSIIGKILRRELH